LSNHKLKLVIFPPFTNLGLLIIGNFATLAKRRLLEIRVFAVFLLRDGVTGCKLLDLAVRLLLNDIFAP
jgi:hypothetical protein